MHKKYLEYVGLSEKEAIIYLALLEVGTISGLDLAKKTGLKKSIVYVILEVLVKRGLAREVIIGKRVQYQSESPDVLRDIIKSKRHKLDDEAHRIETIVSELKSIEKDTGEKPHTRFFDGREAVKVSIEEHVSMDNFSEGKNYGVYSYDVLSKIFSDTDVKNMDEKRIDRDASFKVIYSGAGKVIHTDKNKEAIKIDQDRFPILCDIGVFGDDVRIHTLSKKPYGIHIKSKELAVTLKSLMEYIFSQRV